MTETNTILAKQFSETARKRWQHTALVCVNHHWTYGQLDAMSDHLIEAVRSISDPKDSISLELHLGRDQYLVVSLLAALKAGWVAEWVGDQSTWAERFAGTNSETLFFIAPSAQEEAIGTGKRVLSPAQVLQDSGRLRTKQKDPMDALEKPASRFITNGHTLHPDQLNEAFSSFDRELEPTESDRMLLLQDSSSLHFMVHALWCLLRGVTICIHSDKTQNFNKYLADEKVFPMDFSLFYFGGYPKEAHFANKYRLLADSVQFADRNGFSGVWTPERHFNEFGGLFPNPSVTSASLASLTDQIQIRCGSVVSTLHSNLRLAEEWSVVDNISGGRVSMSFASGWQQNDFVFFPDRYEGRHSFMLEQIKEVSRLWRGEEVPFKGVGDRELLLKVYPEPVQSELPFWITGSGSEQTFADAGRCGANLLTHMFWQDGGELKRKIDIYRSALANNGFDPHSRKVAVMLHTYLGDDRQEALKKVEAPLKDYLRSSLHLLDTMLKSSGDEQGQLTSIGKYKMNNEEVPESVMEELLDIAFDRFANHVSLLGDVAQGKKILANLRTAGVDEVACLIDFGLAYDEVMKGLNYLEELRSAFDGNAIGKQRITISQGLPNMLEDDSDSLQFLSRLKSCVFDSDQVHEVSSLPNGSLVQTVEAQENKASRITISKPEAEKTKQYASLKQAGDTLSEDF